MVIIANIQSFSKVEKILIIQNHIPSYRKGLFNDLAKLYDVTIIHSGKPSINVKDFYKEEIIDCVKIWKFHIQLGIRKYIRENSIDTVICMFDIAWLSGLYLLFDRSVKVVLWGHRYNKSEFLNKIRNFLMLKSNAHILYSEHDVLKMIESGIRKESIFIAHNTLKISNYEDLSAHKTKDSVLYIGRAQKRKKIDILLKSFHSILSKIPSDINIDIIGSGSENELLKKLVVQLGIQDRVIFHGEILDEVRLKEYFKHAIVYASPGPVGLGVLHSQSYGVPVITIKEGLHGPELGNIHPRNGVICSDTENFEENLENLCTNISFSRLLGHESFIHYRDYRGISVMVKEFSNAIQFVK